MTASQRPGPTTAASGDAGFPADSPLTREAVTWAYRALLGGEPESEEMISARLRAGATFAALRAELLASEEFRALQSATPRPGLDGTEPRMEIDDVAEEEELTTLLGHVERTWVRLGETEPHWSVLTADDYLQSRIDTTIEEFHSTGRDDVERALRALERNGIDPASIRSCLEYGCGVGRVTRWLAERFELVYAYDISSAHLDLAGAHLAGQGCENVVLRRVESIGQLDELPRVDFVYSMIVLQHNPPPVIARLLRSLLAALSPGAVALIQIPTYRLGYRFSLAEYLERATSTSELEMHVLPQSRVFEIVRHEGCELVEVLADDKTGGGLDELSNTFVIRRPGTG